MHIVQSIGKMLLGFFGVMAMAAGAFITIAGCLNGLGTPAITARILVAFGGILLSGAGLFGLYLASNKNWENVLDAIISAATFSG